MREPSADLAHHFADLAFDTKYSDLPGDAIDAAKKTILDTLGVSLAASGLEASIGSVLEYAREIGGRPEASVIASDATLPAGLAAFVNGAMAHCLDYDDYTLLGTPRSQLDRPRCLRGRGTARGRSAARR